MQRTARRALSHRRCLPFCLSRATSLVGNQQRRAFASVHPDADKVQQAQALVECKRVVWPTLKVIYGDTSLPAGNDLLRLGSTELAMDAYAQSLRLHPTASACFNMGNVYFQLGAQLDARKHWLRAVELDPQCSADARVNLGNLELSERRPHAALEHYREALRQTPDDAELLFNTAVAHDQAGELADAVSMYERAREGMLSKKRVGGDTDDDDDGEHMARVLERLDMLLRSARARLVASSEADKGK